MYGGVQPDGAETDGSQAADAAMPDVALAPAWTRDGAVLFVAGRTPLDEAAAHLLADLLEERGVGVAVEPAESLTSEGTGLKKHSPRLVMLSFLDADLSLAQARFAVRRLRRRLPLRSRRLLLPPSRPQPRQRRTTALPSGRGSSALWS